MGSLSSALGTASSALDALERAIGVVQNNVANASTPGYVTQTLVLNAGAFDPANHLMGSVQAGNLQSSRNTFAEQNVWAANQQVGMATQQSSNLQAIQSVFDVSGTGGIPGALSSLYSAFSAWSTSPSSAVNQGQVITAAQGVAQAFNTASSSLGTIRTQAQGSTKSTVDQINQLSSQIADINGEIRAGGSGNAGLTAQLYSSLEKLSNLVDFSAETQSDGTVTVLMGGQVPLVIGQTQEALSVTASNPPGSGSNSPPNQQIKTAGGQDVTDRISGGQLGGLLQITNSVLPSLVGNNTQQGSLNQLAQTIADRVNNLLISGETSAGAPGFPLFAYNGSPATAAAGTLSVANGITPAQLAAVDPGPPSVANGVADNLAKLTNSTDPADQLKGLSYTDFYSSIAANVGTLAASASDTETTQNQILTQAQNSRGQVSGVSLNDQAAALLQFQEAYQASAQTITTINTTIQSFLTAMQSL